MQVKKIYIPRDMPVGGEVSIKEAEKIVLGDSSPLQTSAFYELWRCAPLLAIKVADRLWDRTKCGIRVPDRLLSLAREVKEGGPVVSSLSCRVSNRESLVKVFKGVEPLDTIELRFSVGASGFAALSGLAGEVRGTPFEDGCLCPAESILKVNRFPTFDRLFRFNIPRGMTEEDLSQLMNDLSWAIWPGVDYAEGLYRLKCQSDGVDWWTSNRGL